MKRNAFRSAACAVVFSAGYLMTAQADNFGVTSSAREDLYRSGAAVNYSAAGAMDRESRARARLMNSEADLVDNRVRVRNRTEDTEVFGRNVSNVSTGIGSVGDAAARLGRGASWFKHGFGIR